MQDSSEQLFEVTRERRDATVVIRGYVYQVNTTLLKWIELLPDHRLELEAGEDIDVVRQAVTASDGPDRLLAAVKHRERNLTLRSPEALAALATFHEHRQSNPTLKLAFVYLTNSSVGTEAPPITSAGTPGIYLWQQVRDGSIGGKRKASAISAIRQFLRERAAPPDLALSTWESFVRHLKRSTNAELNRLIDDFEWSTEQPAYYDLAGRVLYALRAKSVEEADLAYKHLFYFLFDLLSQRQEKILTAGLLSQELAKLDRSDAGERVLSKLRSLEADLIQRLDRIEEQTSLLPGMAATLALVANAVTSRPESHYELPGPPEAPAAEQSSAVPGGRGQMTAADTSIFYAALLAQNEELAATVTAQTKDLVAAARDAARSDRRSEALQTLRAQRANRTAWHVLSSEAKAAILRLEASILLSSREGTAGVSELLDEARTLSPAESDIRLRAYLAFAEHDPDTAISLLTGSQCPESRNLLALLLLLIGRTNDCLLALPPLDADPATRAETLRIRALALLHSGDPSAAKTAADEALALEPEWPTMQFLAAMVNYYGALSLPRLCRLRLGAGRSHRILFLRSTHLRQRRSSETPRTPSVAWPRALIIR